MSVEFPLHLSAHHKREIKPFTLIRRKPKEKAPTKVVSTPIHDMQMGRIVILEEMSKILQSLEEKIEASRENSNNPQEPHPTI